MKALHLFSNHKITGPAELALETARVLAEGGLDASFYSSDVRKTETRDRWLQLLARERRVPEAPLDGVALTKHISPLRAFRDVHRLTAHLKATPFDVIHCHLPGDHLIAGYALRRSRLPSVLIRTLYDGEPPEPTRRTRKMFGRMTDLLVCHSERVAEALRSRSAEYGGLAPEKIRALPPPIDVRRFDPTREVRPRREALGVPADAFCLGIVARMQTHRRFEVLLEAFRQAREQVADLHLVVVGRGTNQVQVAKDPVEQMGLADWVHFPGYISGEDYVGTLASFDAKVFLVPGSDGTCRAVREALAMGVPLIATRRGMLPELVRDGIDGVLVEETPEDMARGFVRLASDRARRDAMSEAARTGAVERFAFERFAARLQELYREALAAKRAS